jgi:hypothetical protein
VARVEGEETVLWAATASVAPAAVGVLLRGGEVVTYEEGQQIPVAVLMEEAAGVRMIMVHVLVANAERNLTTEPPTMRAPESTN